MDTITTYKDYVPNLQSPDAMPAPCANPKATPQKVCGTMSGPASGDSTEVNWVQLAHTTSATPEAAKALSSTNLLVRQVSIGAPTTNVADVRIGPNNSANAVTFSAGMNGYLVEMPDGTAFDLSLWFSKSASATQSLVILYLPA